MNRYILVERKDNDRPWVIRDVIRDADVYKFAGHDETFARAILANLRVLIAEGVTA